MMSPEKIVNEINHYLTNLVFETLQNHAKKYALLRLPWILVAKMLVTIRFNVVAGRLRMTHGGSRFLKL